MIASKAFGAAKNEPDIRTIGVEMCVRIVVAWILYLPVQIPHLEHFVVRLTKYF